MIAATHVVEVARSWVGTRWRHQACAKGVGVDCVHFIAGVARELGIKEAADFFATPAFHNYGRTPDPAVLYGGCDSLMTQVPLAEATLGDVLVIKFGKHPMHFAFLSNLAPRRMVHAWARRREVVEHGLEEPWVSRIDRVYRLPGVV